MKKNKPSCPNGFKAFGKAQTKLSKKELKDMFLVEDKEFDAENKSIDDKFKVWWTRHGKEFCYGCATNLKKIAAASFIEGYFYGKTGI